MILVGEKTLGLSTMLIVFLLLVIFWLFPSLVTWYIVGVIYIAQMAYAVAKATIHKTKETYREITPNSNLAQKLPEKFSDKKQLAKQVYQSLSTIVNNDDHLIAAVVGLKLNTSRFIFVGATNNHLILADCNQSGNPVKPRLIQNGHVEWLDIKLGERNLILTIEEESGKIIPLHIPGKLREQAKALLENVPGTWATENPIEDLVSLHTQEFRSGAVIVYGISFIIFIIAMLQTDNMQQPYQRIAEDLIWLILLFVFGWPPFVYLVRRFVKEPGITSVNVFASFSGIGIASLWLMTIHFTGVIVVALVKYIQSLG